MRRSIDALARPWRGLGARSRMPHTGAVHEPISRWYASLVVLASLPFACIALFIGFVTSSFWVEIGLAWISVLGLLTLVVQVAVALLNRLAPDDRLPRARISHHRVS
ncbi:MAG TPA: hypothetical protein VFK02_23575 [Kofleriaceae bacterium]|nr:hypothetical protein [Kofleriaceae bacterium]